MMIVNPMRLFLCNADAIPSQMRKDNPQQRFSRPWIGSSLSLRLALGEAIGIGPYARTWVAEKGGVANIRACTLRRRKAAYSGRAGGTCLNIERATEKYRLLYSYWPRVLIPPSRPATYEISIRIILLQGCFACWVNGKVLPSSLYCSASKFLGLHCYRSQSVWLASVASCFRPPQGPV